MIQLNETELNNIKYLMSLVLSAKYHLDKADLNNSLVATAINALDRADKLIPYIIDSIYIEEHND